MAPHFLVFFAGSAGYGQPLFRLERVIGFEPAIFYLTSTCSHGEGVLLPFLMTDKLRSPLRDSAFGRSQSLVRQMIILCGICQRSQKTQARTPPHRRLPSTSLRSFMAPEPD